MALHTVIRRASSKIIPLALRYPISGSQRNLHNYSRKSLLAAGQNRVDFSAHRSFPFVSNKYSTRPISDEKLLLLIESEIHYVEEPDDQAGEVPPGFSFKIEDKPGNQAITLTQEDQDEMISVEVHMPDFTSDNDDEAGEERGIQSSLPLTVKVAKKSGPCLEFSCTAYLDEISIDSLSVNIEDQIDEGPDFSNLDENLQKAFQEYLEIRGIKPSITNFLHSYMIEKESKEYATWLKNLQKFFKAEAAAQEI